MSSERTYTFCAQRNLNNGYRYELTCLKNEEDRTAHFKVNVWKLGAADRAQAFGWSQSYEPSNTTIATTAPTSLPRGLPADVRRIIRETWDRKIGSDAQTVLLNFTAELTDIDVYNNSLGGDTEQLNEAAEALNTFMQMAMDHNREDDGHAAIADMLGLPRDGGSRRARRAREQRNSTGSQ